jgi:hypothetical protein
MEAVYKDSQINGDQLLETKDICEKPLLDSVFFFQPPSFSGKKR